MDYERRVDTVYEIYKEGYLGGRKLDLVEVESLSRYEFRMSNEQFPLTLFSKEKSRLDVTLFGMPDSGHVYQDQVGMIVNPFWVGREDFANSFFKDAWTGYGNEQRYKYEKLVRGPQPDVDGPNFPNTTGQTGVFPFKFE